MKTILLSILAEMKAIHTEMAKANAPARINAPLRIEEKAQPPILSDSEAIKWIERASANAARSARRNS